MESATGLGATLRLWRDRLPPSAAGLPARSGRRTAGLRREELAELAGLSVDYVVRLEQGRATSPSPQVAGALARALQLDDGERDHLFRLAGLAPPSREAVPRHISPGVQRALARLDGTAAVAVFAADWQLLWWNRTWAGLFGDPLAIPVRWRNFARSGFLVPGDGDGDGDGGGRAEAGVRRLSQWPVESVDEEAVRAAVVADLRRACGRYPRDRALAALVRELRDGSEGFAALWATGAVGTHRADHKVVHHPAVGPTTLDCDVLTDGDADLKIVVMTAAPGSEDESRLQLAALAGQVGAATP
ncbi:helix-turn-helix transcriptional regulator [Streptomyces sp. NP160]|uniref:helix-turn-helix transcriptional regulator n=1 Tax=Streptomyces sp. NP160 TaxID=2586637 RepID=UPI0011198A4D|nr:helix-turn-helix transcriptional regulator [Streptomyces sp. NP160]TNM69682.1 helix-turn-helix transcriptional regulator [Streptomyces sp. NP160]